LQLPSGCSRNSNSSFLIHQCRIVLHVVLCSMDIQRWLKDTCEPRQKRVVNATYQPQQIDEPPVRQKRRRVLVASSQLGSEPTTVISPLKRPRRNSETSSASSTSTSSSESSSSISEHQSDQYERKPRRKTRPDLYEPQSGSRKRQSRAKQSKKKKVKTKHRKTKKSRKEQNSGRALVNNFNAKNVPKSRLTVSRLPCILMVLWFAHVS